MTKLVIVRSGSTDWNTNKRIQGTVDVPLNRDGRATAEKISSELAGVEIDAVYSSCLSRSYETARIIATRHALKPKKLKELNELNQGLWQGLCEGEIRKRYRKQYSLWRTSPFSTKPPRGEGIKDAYDRVINVVQKIIDKNKGQTVCLVAHEVVIALIKCHLNNDINTIWQTVPGIGSWEVIETG